MESGNATHVSGLTCSGPSEWSVEKLEDRTFCRAIKKAPFYYHLQSEKAEIYQKYLDIALEVCPTLEFEEDDPFLQGLFEKAIMEDNLDLLELEMVMLQYANADLKERERYNEQWVEIILAEGEGSFYPGPWQIIESLFVH